MSDGILHRFQRTTKLEILGVLNSETWCKLGYMSRSMVTKSIIIIIIIITIIILLFSKNQFFYLAKHYIQTNGSPQNFHSIQILFKICNKIVTFLPFFITCTLPQLLLPMNNLSIWSIMVKTSKKVKQPECYNILPT